MPQWHFTPDENRVRLALNGVPSANAQIMYGANHVVETHEEGAPEKCENHGAEESTNESFYSLFRR